MTRPTSVILAVFVLVVVIGGSNSVAVRFSNRELPPFWGAGIRFAAAWLLFLAIAAARHVPLPRGRSLAGAALFGVLNFGVFYALGYWALLEAPAVLASTLLALVPLMTFLIAVALGMERFRWGGVVGGVVAVVGVAVVFADQLRATVSPASLLALLAAAAAAAIATIIAKRLPRADPIATNVVAAAPGSAFLLGLSWVAHEPTVLPTRIEVWIAFAYLVLNTVVLFASFLFLVRRWTASATAYATVLFPIVTVALGAVLAGEFVTTQFVAGAALVMIGVYLGAIAQPAPTPAAAPQAPRAS